MDLNLTNRVALVTGGTRGLGHAVCQGLAAEGAKVAINFRQQRQLAADLVEQIRSEHDTSAVPIQADVSDANEVERMFDQCEDQLGPPDILINNAGVWATACFQDITEADWDQTFAVNLKATFFTCQTAVRRWQSADRRGRIVNVSSATAFLGTTTGHAHYAAAKAGMVNLTVSLAREVAAHGIAVNAVAPGMMRTDMVRDVLEAGEQQYVNRIPLQRIGDPAEVANIIVLLASERASYMTGATVDVSGGLLMR